MFRIEFAHNTILHDDCGDGNGNDGPMTTQTPKQDAKRSVESVGTLEIHMGTRHKPTGLRDLRYEIQNQARIFNVRNDESNERTRHPCDETKRGSNLIWLRVVLAAIEG